MINAILKFIFLGIIFGFLALFCWLVYENTVSDFIDTMEKRQEIIYESTGGEL